MPNFYNTNIEKKPAPWQLTGSAYVFLYYFSKKTAQSFHSYMSDYQIDNWKGGFGSIILVNYESSDVGPYYELIFIPGNIFLAGKKGYSIAHITVSSMESVLNGRENWAIPKDQATFDWQKLDDNQENIKVSLGNDLYFELTCSKSKLKFPITTAILPLNIIQKQENKIYITQPSAKGMASLANIMNLQIDTKYLPDLSKCKLLVSLALQNFKMEFPVAQIIES